MKEGGGALEGVEVGSRRFFNQATNHPPPLDRWTYLVDSGRTPIISVSGICPSTALSRLSRCHQLKFWLSIWYQRCLNAELMPPINAWVPYPRSFTATQTPAMMPLAGSMGRMPM